MQEEVCQLAIYYTADTPLARGRTVGPTKRFSVDAARRLPLALAYFFFIFMAYFMGFQWTAQTHSPVFVYLQWRAEVELLHWAIPKAWSVT